MRTKIILTALAVLMVNKISAQNMGLKVGDRLPDFTVDKMINCPIATARTSDYRDQLLIVDFWATNCPGCVEALPKMEALQKKFGQKVKILPVTYEKAALVQEFWKTNSYTKGLSLPSVVEDTRFTSFFRHRSIPHEVWVYKGVVIGVTTAEYVDDANISKILSGEKVYWPVKNDFYRFDALREPVFALDPAQLDTAATFIKYASICDYRSGVNSEGLSGGSGIVRDPVKKTIRAFFLNQPIYTSYQLLMQQIQSQEATMLIKPSNYGIGPNETVWEVMDRFKYSWAKERGYEQDWVRANAICFESVNPDTGQTDLVVKKSILKDMNRLLGLNVRWEKRREKVLKLVAVSAKAKGIPLPATGNMTAGNIVYTLNQQPGNPYVFNQLEDLAQKKLNIVIKDWTDINAVKKAIAPYGLELREEEMEVDKLVFSEVDGGMLVDRQMMLSAKDTKVAQANMKNPSVDENNGFLVRNKKQPGIRVLPSGLQYKVIKMGTGARPLPNERVSVHFTGTLVNGKIFDSSMENGVPLVTPVDGVIEGWKQILQQMPVGSKWIIYVPAELAYGTHTNQGRIPPNSVLVFEIELLAIMK